MSLRRYHEVLFLLIIVSFFIIGFLGPKFWKIPQPLFVFKAIQNNFSNPVVRVDRLHRFYSNSNYLSSDQFNDKIVVFKWSENILNYVKNDIPIPRMYFPFIPKNISQYETYKKKSVFTAILLPIALRGNELVLEERRLMKIAFSTNNIYQIERFSKKYKVKNFKKINFSNLNRSELRRIKSELLNKINILPISLILDQAIIESVWGASRFAQEGNALFGQWTWKNKDGIKPKRNLNANFSVKNFKNLLHSVNSYILNLNTHPAYKELRNFRTSQNKMNETVTGNDMANFLEKYAEIGLEYVTKVKIMIKKNQLSKFENSTLGAF
jgi:Bax protein